MEKMKYTVLYEQDGAIMVSRKMSLDLAQKMCDSYLARGIVSWVEDDENNKVYPLEAE